MDDLEAMHPTAGYLFAEELDVHFTDLNSTLLLLDAADCCFSLLQPSGSCAAPSSPSSVAFLPSHYPPSPVKPTAFSPLDAAVFIKPEPLHDVIEHSFLTPVPTVTNERERLRCRQRGYEKRYRGRKRKSLNMQRDTWLALEMKLAATRRKHCKPYVHQTQSSLQSQMLLLLQEERALVEDRVAMKSLQAWERITRIREYADKDALRTVSEWRHSAVKVIGPCGVLAPGRFHPYAPMEQLHFTW